MLWYGRSDRCEGDDDVAFYSAALTDLLPRTGDMCALHVTLCAALKLQLSPSVCKAAVQECYLRILMSVKYDATIDAARAQFFGLTVCVLADDGDVQPAAAWLRAEHHCTTAVASAALAEF